MKKSLFLLTLLSAFGAPAMATVAIPSSSVAPPPSVPSLPPGLYVQVIDGLISVTNKGGSTNFAAGQFGYTANVTQAPAMLPQNPGLAFSPPISFKAPVPATTSSSASQNTSVDCEVR
ncbi:MAG: hypothetical protein RR311_01510 [Comamonas sp.]